MTFNGQWVKENRAARANENIATREINKALLMKFVQESQGQASRAVVQAWPRKGLNRPLRFESRGLEPSVRLTLAHARFLHHAIWRPLYGVYRTCSHFVTGCFRFIFLVSWFVRDEMVIGAS